MKITKFIIENYRGIINTEISLKNNLIPLIGINESGKTSVLSAMLCFDKRRDLYNKGEHLIYETRLDLEPQPAKIKAEIVIETEAELNAIANKLEISHGDSTITELLDCKNKKKPIVVVRTLTPKENTYSIEGIAIPVEMNNKIAEVVFELSPYILYFPDFKDPVDEKITFPKGYDYKNFKKKDTTGFLESRALLMEIFKQATNEKYSLEDFINLDEDDDKKEDILLEVKNRLHNDIIKEWGELRKKGLAPSEYDEENLALELKYKHHRDNETKFHEFKFKVIDSSGGTAGRNFSLGKRSTGFNWFFNFIIKLKYNHEHPENDPSAAIYLLDEPGANLHSSAQEGLLIELQKRSERNLIAFGTHSQYLLDPTIVNPKAIKIVQKQKGIVTVIPFNHSTGRRDEGAYTPIYHALHLKLGTHLFFDKKVIITEGISDYYLFNMLFDNSVFLDINGITLIPGQGALNLGPLISLAIGCSDNYLVLLDSDKLGCDAFIKYQKQFGEEESQNFFKYKTTSLDSGVVLEAHLSSPDQQRLRELTGVSDIKTAIITLFYMRAETQGKFIKNLDDETMGNLNFVITCIQSLCKEQNDKEELA